ARGRPPRRQLLAPQIIETSVRHSGEQPARPPRPGPPPQMLPQSTTNVKPQPTGSAMSRPRFLKVALLALALTGTATWLSKGVLARPPSAAGAPVRVAAHPLASTADSVLAAAPLAPREWLGMSGALRAIIDTPASLAQNALLRSALPGFQPSSPGIQDVS